MEKENKKLRDKAKKERNEEIRVTIITTQDNLPSSFCLCCIVILLWFFVVFV